LTISEVDVDEETSAVSLLLEEFSPLPAVFVGSGETEVDEELVGVVETGSAAVDVLATGVAVVATGA
jgi:hypothetical protein